MNFADELRKTSQREKKNTVNVRVKDKAVLKAERLKRERENTINSGRFVDSEYKRLKEQAKEAAMFDAIYADMAEEKKETFIPSRSCEFEVFYKAEEYLKMYPEVYHAKYADAKSKMIALFTLNKTHCVFTKDECDIIKTQFTEKLQNDGLSFNFVMKEFFNEVYEESWLWGTKAVKTDLCGYTLCIKVSW